MRHTRIIATVGPAVDSDVVLDGLIAEPDPYAASAATATTTPALAVAP